MTFLPHGSSQVTDQSFYDLIYIPKEYLTGLDQIKFPLRQLFLLPTIYYFEEQVYEQDTKFIPTMVN